MQFNGCTGFSASTLYHNHNHNHNHRRSQRKEGYHEVNQYGRAKAIELHHLHHSGTEPVHSPSCWAQAKGS